MVGCEGMVGNRKLVRTPLSNHVPSASPSLFPGDSARRQACHTANAFADALPITAVNLVMTQAAVLRVGYAFNETP